MTEATIIVQAKKSIDDVAALYIEILPDGKNVRWCFSSRDLTSFTDSENAEIEYDYAEEDENLEPRPFISVAGAKHYMDEFVLVE
jgi:hypothetical protein